MLILISYFSLSKGIPCNLRVPFRNTASNSNELFGSSAFCFQFTSLVSSPSEIKVLADEPTQGRNMQIGILFECGIVTDPNWKVH